MIAVSRAGAAMSRLLSRLSFVAGLLLVALPASSQSLPGGNPATPEQVRFYHSDSLGSVRAVTDIEGQIVSRSDYLPFGEQIPPEKGRGDLAGHADDAGNKQKFTGKERDGENGLDYFGARYFSGAQGRFTSSDPRSAGADLANPQTWNAYAYALNGPLRYVDPDGAQAAEAALSLQQWAQSTGNPYAIVWAGALVVAATNADSIAQGVNAAIASGAFNGSVPTYPGVDVVMDRKMVGHMMASNRKQSTPSQGSATPGQPGASTPQGPEFEPNPKHRSADRGESSRGPTDGPGALGTSVQIKDTSPGRVGVDRKNGEIVVFREHEEGKFHGYVVTWKNLTDQQRNALVNANLTNRRGTILPE